MICMCRIDCLQGGLNAIAFYGLDIDNYSQVALLIGEVFKTPSQLSN
jgi:hypothetical protein